MYSLHNHSSRLEPILTLEMRWHTHTHSLPLPPSLPPSLPLPPLLPLSLSHPPPTFIHSSPQNGLTALDIAAAAASDGKGAASDGGDSGDGDGDYYGVYQLLCHMLVSSCTLCVWYYMLYQLFYMVVALCSSYRTGPLVIRPAGDQNLLMIGTGPLVNRTHHCLLYHLLRTPPVLLHSKDRLAR